MMLWLPLSMATAAIISTDMMVSNNVHSTVTKVHGVKSCHQHSDNQTKNNQPSHQCTFCNACVLASAGAVLSPAPLFVLISGNANKQAALDIPFYSDYISNTIKPPILH